LSTRNTTTVYVMPRRTMRKTPKNSTKRSSPGSQKSLYSAARRNAENGPPLPLASNDLETLAVTRMFDQGTITSSLVADSFSQFTVGLSSLPNPTEFTTLFDQYRISRVEYHFWPLQTEAVNSTTAVTPGIITVVDYDDSGSLATVTAAFQYPNAVWRSAYKPFCVSFKPHIAVAAFSGAFTSYMNTKDQWIDASSPAVIHYGLKICMPQSTGIVQSWRVIGKALVELKNVR
jgi:hypothetical protein